MKRLTESKAELAKMMGKKSVDDFDFIKECMLDKLGAGPERGQTTFKMPDAAIYFVAKNNQNVTRAFEEMTAIIRKSNDYWRAKIP